MKLIPLILILFLSACARPPAPLWTDIPAAEHLLERLHARSGRTLSLDAAAAVSINSAGRHFSSQQFLLVRQPDQVRIDALSSFGQLLLQLATDGETLSVLLNTTSPPRFFSGVASEDNFSRFVHLPVPAHLLVPLLLYDPPLMRHQERQVEARENQLVLALTDGGFQQKFYFDGQFQLAGMDYEFEGEKILSVGYSRFSSEDAFPRRIEIDIPGENKQLAMRINDLVLNPEIPPARFRLPPPTGIAIEPIP